MDDHNVVRAGVVALLATRWEICGEAADGLEAIEKANELKPDLILLDLNMPLLSGTRAAPFIRTLSPNTKIVFISIYDGPTVADLVKTAGADGFISKRCGAMREIF